MFVKDGRRNVKTTPSRGDKTVECPDCERLYNRRVTPHCPRCGREDDT